MYLALLPFTTLIQRVSSMLAAELPSDLSASPGLLHDLLTVSLTGVNLLRPLYGPGGELDDFALEYLNPAAQRMTGLSAQPGGTTRTHFPAIFTNGVFDFYRRVFETGEASRYSFNYQADGFDSYFHVVAQRSGERLLVSFTDTADQDRSAVEVALRAAQAREQAARAEAEAQRQLLQEVFHQAPVAIALLEGPTYRITLANPTVCELWAQPASHLLGRPLLDALPALQGQGVDTLLDGVLRSGEPFVGTELPFALERHGRRETIYFNFVYQPQRNVQGETTGVLIVATDVTQVVTNRQQVEAKEQETAALNEELAAANEEIRANNDELFASQTELLSLNHELEARVQARTQDAQARQDELQRILQQAPVAIALFRGAQYTIELVNDMHLALWGRTRAQVLGRPLFEALPEAAGQGFEELLDGVVRTGQPYVARELSVHLLRHGVWQDVFFNFVYQPLREADGRISGVAVVAHDITEQVQGRRQVEQLNRQLEAARAEAERQRRQWEQLFLRAPAAICIFDGPEWVYEFVNPGYQAMFFGRELLGKRLVDALPEVADQPLMQILHHVYDTGETFEGKEVLVPLARTEDGPIEDIYFDLTYLARYNEAGQIDGFVTYAYDVTEQVRARHEREALQAQQLAVAERRVQEREELYQIFSQSSALILLLRGPEHRIEYVNEAYARLFPGRGLQGSPLAASLPEAEAQGFTALLDGVYHTGQMYAGVEVPLTFRPAVGRPPQTIYFNFTYQAYQQDGHTQGVSVFAYDATEQVRARQQVQDLNEELAAINEELTATNEELNESNAQLTRTNVDLDTFIYTASHDLKAPISNIEAILLALRDTLPAEVRQDELVAQLLEMLQGTVARFQLTISQLTDITKLQLAHAGPAEPVQLAQVVEHVRQDLTPLLQQAATQLTVEVASDLVVSFSPANLRSIVYNLLSNASKYRDPTRPSQVLVRATQTAQAVVLTVQDNGLGMSEVQQRQLFGLFQRLHTHVEGTGVGLYIVKRLVENGGGTITVQSQPDVGTIFTVLFPYPRT